jgi:flavodoxin
MDKKEFGIHFGALAEPIEKQLENQGLITKAENIKKFNDLNHARLMLLFGSCITDSENDKICKKIFNWFKKTVKPLVK